MKSNSVVFRNRITARFLPVALLLCCLQANLHAADPLDEWKWRNPLPQGNRMSAVTYGGGLFIGVGDYGAIITSPDPTTSPWAVSLSPTNGDLRSIAYGTNGMYVAAGVGGGNSGMILTSPDGTNWFKQSWTNSATREIYGVAYGAGVFVAVGERSGVWTSADGTNWIRRLNDAGSSSHLNGIVYQEGVGFVAIGSAGKVLVSLDGVTWVTNASPTTLALNAITYGTNGLSEGTFMAVGASGAIFSSPDAVTWTLQNSLTTVALKGVAYGPGVGFSAVGSSSSVSWVTASPDGVTWTAGLPSVPNEDYRSVAYAGGKFVAVGHYGGSISSTTGNSGSWVARTAYGWTVYNNWGAWSGTNFVVVGTGGSVVTSPNGINWVQQASPVASVLRAVAWGTNNFVAVGDGGVILTSEDAGTNWLAQISPVGTTINGISYINGAFMAVGASGAILTSPDGTNWTLQTSFTANTLRGAAYGGGLYVAVGDSGTVLTSPDRINWAPQALGNTRAINSVIYAANNFIAIGERNRIITSANGTNWILRTVEAGSGVRNLNGIAFGSGRIVVAGGDAAIMSSPTGTNWTIHVAINSISQRFIVAGADSFIVSGSGGVMIRANIPAIVTPPYITMVYTNSVFTLIWPGGGTLQSAPLVTGTYTNVPGAVSPYSIGPLTQPQQYFRVSIP